ncbi:AAA family ATPase [Stappia sp. GBMRC 2046]|uniref:AAA family ATPase n=1 Tax=Stappia sediminis TaxID=2692190 RepID=A0A7X3S8W0_9HYPH|nr:AAA family ATPase [Stappia sediminis]MXN66227.1 AAA family ATPase [Stappia sediminis]
MTQAATASGKETNQERVIAFMSDGRTHGGADVKRIDTHAAIVFLAGQKAYKLKRAVRFPFLDFSTLEKRKAACDREIERNRLFAPDIYLGVEPVTRDDSGNLAISGDGETIDWLVVMRRFDEMKTLDHIADRHGIDDALADGLADIMVEAHSKAEVRDAASWIIDLGRYLEQNDEAFRADPDLFPQHRAEALTLEARKTYHRLGELLHARGRQGKVRLGHGDAHLGNIVLIEGKPSLFDAVEFDDTIATGDILYDLAFLLMDLWERGERIAANRVFNRYLALGSGATDYDALTALPFFLMMRAAIRAKVTAAALPHQPAEGRPAAAASARRYFECAERFMEPHTPRLFAIGGLSGTGKTTQARLLAPLVGHPPGAVLLRTDVFRKRHLGLGETEPAPPEAYEPQAHAEIYDLMLNAADRCLAGGCSVILDAVFAREEEREAARRLAKALELPFAGIWLEAPHEVKTSRVTARKADASDASAKVVAMQESFDLGRMDWQRIDASRSIDEIQEELGEYLGVRTG